MTSANAVVLTDVCVVGVELAQRTGKNPKYSYLSLGCSKNAENVMLNYAKGLVGRPFSNSGMMRSVIFPRITDDSSFFCAGASINTARSFMCSYRRSLVCAELVAAVLKKGGLMSRSSNPGSATPQSLWQMYKGKAAVTGNPFVLRNFASQHSQKQSVSANPVAFSLPLRKAAPIASSNTATASRRRDSPPRASFKLVSGSGTLTTHNLALLKR